MTLVTREPQGADFKILVDLWNQAHSENPISVAKLETMIVVPADYLKPGGMVVEQAGCVVGFGTYRWSQHLTDPPVKFWIGHLVSKPNQMAIQEQICHALEQKAAAWGQSAVYAVVREDNSPACGDLSAPTIS